MNVRQSCKQPTVCSYKKYTICFTPLQRVCLSVADEIRSPWSQISRNRAMCQTVNGPIREHVFGVNTMFINRAPSERVPWSDWIAHASTYVTDKDLHKSVGSSNTKEYIIPFRSLVCTREWNFSSHNPMFTMDHQL